MEQKVKERLKNDRLKAEEEYLDKAINGDDEAFGALVCVYEKLVYNIAYNAVGNPDDAYDVSQDVFLKAYTAIKHFRKDSSFSTWLHKIAFNSCHDFLRQRSKRDSRYLSLSEYEDEDGGHELQIPDNENTPEREFENRELKELIQEGILMLHPEHKKVILLREIEGLSYEEISEITGSNIGTVKSRINRARLKLQDFLKDKI